MRRSDKQKFWLNIVTGQVCKAAKHFPNSFGDHKPDSLYQPIGMFYNYATFYSELKDGEWIICRGNTLNVVMAVKVIPAKTDIPAGYLEKIIAGAVRQRLTGNFISLSKVIADVKKEFDIK